MKKTYAEQQLDLINNHLDELGIPTELAGGVSLSVYGRVAHLAGKLSEAKKEQSLRKWLDKPWPLKMYEGGVSVERLPGGHYRAQVIFFIYDHGKSAPRGEYVDIAATPEEALAELWERSIVKLKKMAESSYLPEQLHLWLECYGGEAE